MLRRLEASEPSGPRLDAWRYLDVVLTAARDRLIAHRTAGQTDEAACFSDRTFALHRTPDLPPSPGSERELAGLYREVVGDASGRDWQDILIGLTRSAAALSPQQRRLLRGLFLEVGYPPVDLAGVTRRVTVLLRDLAPTTESP
jgi:hypothetical protein